MLIQSLFRRKQIPEIAELRDQLIQANAQVEFLLDRLRPKREVRRDAGKFIEKRKAVREALERLYPDVARSIRGREAGNA